MPLQYLLEYTLFHVVCYRHCLVNLGHRQVVNELHMQAQLLECIDGVLVPHPLRLVFGHQYKLLLQQPRALGDVVLCRRDGVGAAKINDQALLDTKDGIGCLVRVTAKVEGASNVSSRIGSGNVRSR